MFQIIQIPVELLLQKEVIMLFFEKWDILFQWRDLSEQKLKLSK